MGSGIAAAGLGGLTREPMLAADGAVGAGVVWDSAAAAMDQINREALTTNQVSARTIRRARPTVLIALPLDVSVRLLPVRTHVGERAGAALLHS